MTTEDLTYAYEKCKAWRTTNRYTRRQHSELTGFSESSINDFESGFIKGNRNRPVGAAAMQRYRLTVAAVANGLTDWNWGESK